MIILKIIRWIFIVFIGLIVLLTGYLMVDAYFIHPDMKGLNILGLKQIGLFLLIPLSLLLMIIMIEQGIKRNNQ